MTHAGRDVLRARALKKVWVDGDRQIDIALDRLLLRAGDFVAITGASGSGKSTVLDMLSLVLRPDQGGELYVDDDDGLRYMRHLVDAQNEGALAKVRARVFGYVVQTSELIPFLTGFENCVLQQQISGRGDPHDIAGLAAALDVAGLLGSYPSTLSVGQRQRVAIVRALCCRPRIVLADEPTASQDPQLKDTVIGVLRRISGQGCAVLMVTHDVPLLERHDIHSIACQAGILGKVSQSRFCDERLAS